MMKSISTAFIIMFSIGIVIGQIIALINPTIVSMRITSVSFIGLGIGAILFGIYMLKANENNKEG